MTNTDSDQSPEEDVEASPADIENEGFSLEALNRAYARAVAEQNGEPLPEDTPATAEIESHDTNDTPSGDQLLDEERDNAGCEISPKSILEAMLFVGTPDNTPLKSRNLAALMRGVSPKEIVQLTRELNKDYEESGSVFRIKRDGGGYVMALHDEFENVRQKYYGEVKHASLSQAAIDILSIVAYNQPMSREQVEKSRGKSAGPILLQLVRRGLLEREKTTEKPVKTLFRTTDRFLELFGLEDIRDLPQSEDVDLLD